MSTKSAPERLQRNSSEDEPAQTNSWFKGFFKRIQSPLADTAKLNDTRITEENSMSVDGPATYEKDTAIQLQKSVSLNLSTNEMTKSTPVPISRARSSTDTNSEMFSPLRRPSGGSLPIFPSLEMFSGSPSKSFGGQSLREMNEEFDASEMVLFLSQGAK